MSKASGKRAVLYFDATFPLYQVGGYGPIEFGRDIPPSIIKQYSRNHQTGMYKFCLYNHPKRIDATATLRMLVRRGWIEIHRVAWATDVMRYGQDGDFDNLIDHVKSKIDT